jgi:hypothetical protein
MSTCVPGLDSRVFLLVEPEELDWWTPSSQSCLVQGTMVAPLLSDKTPAPAMGRLYLTHARLWCRRPLDHFIQHKRELSILPVSIWGLLYIWYLLGNENHRLHGGGDPACLTCGCRIKFPSWTIGTDWFMTCTSWWHPIGHLNSMSQSVWEHVSQFIASSFFYQDMCLIPMSNPLNWTVTWPCVLSFYKVFS